MSGDDTTETNFFSYINASHRKTSHKGLLSTLIKTVMVIIARLEICGSSFDLYLGGKSAGSVVKLSADRFAKLWP